MIRFSNPGFGTLISRQCLRELYEAVKGRLDIKQPLHRQPYGLSEFEVRDPNGYVLFFGELIE